MPRAIRQTDGYSLIEMLLVITIIGILSVAALNGLSGAKQPGAVKSTAGTLVGFLQEAANSSRLRGVTTVVTTTGNTPGTLQLSFTGADGILVRYARAADDVQVRNNSVLDYGATSYGVTTTPNPLPQSTAGVKDILGGGSPPLPAALFTGSTSTSLSFDTRGRANSSFYIAVIGAQSGATYAAAPIALILVTPTNGVHAFYKTVANDLNQPWKRL